MNLQESIRRILKEETEDGMKDIMFDIFDENTKGAEIYEYNDSLWMIIPETKEWVFWIDSNLNLRYKYDFFNKIYRYVSLDVVDNQNYITKWVEDILKTGVRNTISLLQASRVSVEDIIKKGVRNTENRLHYEQDVIEDIIEKGEKIE